MAEKKKICFYSIMCSGHLNVCVSLAKSILDNHSDKVDVYFVCNEEWEAKLRKMDDRFKLAKYEYKTNEAKNRTSHMIDSFKAFLKKPHLEKVIGIWHILLEDKAIVEIDALSREQIRKINPDFLLCDQVFSLPGMQDYPYAFVASANPLVFRFDGFPIPGIDIGVDEKEKIKQTSEQLKDLNDKFIKTIEGYYLQQNVEIPDGIPLDKLISKHFSIYTYPSELNYYDEEIQRKYNLWQIDCPLIPNRIPKPFDLPEDFKNLPGKIVYLSLGSLFSAYVEEIQKFVDILDKLPHKFIVSKGPNGNALKFPSNKFIGENFVDQLAVLQVCDVMIAHGGNNTFTECFYFGVPQIVAGILGDQINNQKRIVETGYGYDLNLMYYTEDELLSTVEKALADTELKVKLAKISQRIQKENKIEKIATRVVDYVCNL